MAKGFELALTTTRDSTNYIEQINLLRGTREKLTLAQNPLALVVNMYLCGSLYIKFCANN
jgi:hypothetical protein